MSMDMEGTGAVDTAAMAAAGVPAAADVNGRRPSVGMRNPKEGLNKRRSLKIQDLT